MIRWTCNQCGGYGGFEIEEDGRQLWHACYRCGTDGYHEMSEEQFCDMVNEEAAEAVELDKADRQHRRIV